MLPIGKMFLLHLPGLLLCLSELIVYFSLSFRFCAVFVFLLSFICLLLSLLSCCHSLLLPLISHSLLLSTFILDLAHHGHCMSLLYVASLQTGIESRMSMVAGVMQRIVGVVENSLVQANPFILRHAGFQKKPEGNQLALANAILK